MMMDKGRRSKISIFSRVTTLVGPFFCFFFLNKEKFRKIRHMLFH